MDSKPTVGQPSPVDITKFRIRFFMDRPSTFARCSSENIRSALAKQCKRFGVDMGGTSGQAGAEPPPKLRAVIEQLMRDPSNAQEVAAKLQREDPALLKELMQWIENQR